MLQPRQLERAALQHDDAIASIREFLLSTGLLLDTPTTLRGLLLRRQTDPLFRRDFALYVTTLLPDRSPSALADAVAIIALAAAGPAAGRANAIDAQELLRVLRQPGLVTASAASPVVARRPAATKATALAAGALCVAVVVGWFAVRQPRDWEETVAATMPATTSAVPQLGRPANTSATSAATLGVQPPLLRAAPNASLAAPRYTANEPRVSRPRYPTLQQQPAPVVRMPPTVTDTSVGNTAAPMPQPSFATRATRNQPGPVPTSVLSARIGARTVPAWVSSDPAMVSGPPQLLRRRAPSPLADSTGSNELVASNHPISLGNNVAARASGVVRPVSLGMMAGNVLYSPAPAYPPAAAAAHVEGQVTVQAEVDRAGNVASARVVSGPPLLRDAAVDAVQRWRYRPYLAGGRAVAMNATAVLEFELP